MIKDLTSVILCIWLAKKLRGWSRGEVRKDDVWSLAKQSLKWGMIIVTVPLLEFFGIMSFIHGIGYPSIFSFSVCIGLITLLMLGCALEITGNVLIDSLLLSSILVISCFTLVNGIPVAWANLSQENLCRWFITSIFVSLFFRAALWIKEGK